MNDELQVGANTRILTVSHMGGIKCRSNVIVRNCCKARLDSGFKGATVAGNGGRDRTFSSAVFLSNQNEDVRRDNICDG